MRSGLPIMIRALSMQCQFPINGEQLKRERAANQDDQFHVRRLCRARIPHRSVRSTKRVFNT